MTEDQPVSPAPKPTWRNGVANPSAPQQAVLRSRRRLIVLVFFNLLAVAGAVVGWLLHLDTFREPYFLTLALTEYDDPHLPVNAFAEQDSDLLLTHFSAKQRKKAFGSQRKHLMREELSALRNRGDQPVVVHLCAHARTAGGVVYVLPGEAPPDDPGQWLPLGEVLQALSHCPAPHKLLLLDLMRPIADPSLGILVNEVADQVAQALQKGDDDHLQVLCACSPGQVSLASEDLRQSVFAHYLDQGLSGWADGYPDHKPDGRVSVHELAAFVSDRVDRWALRNAGVRQTPFLAGKGKDFPVAARERRRVPPPEMSPEPEPYPDRLRASWKLRDDEAARNDPGLAPQGMNLFETAVLRAEQRWRGGVALPSVQRVLEKDVSRFQEQCRQARAKAPRPEDSRSLAQAARLGRFQRDPAAQEALTTLFKKLDNLPIQPMDEKVKKDRDALKQEFLEKIKGKSPVATAWALLDALAEETNPRPDKIAFLSKELLVALDPPLRDFTETLYLRRLLDLHETLVTKKKNVQWPLPAVRYALRCLRDGETLSQVDPRSAPWIRGMLTAANSRRSEGERILFTPVSDADMAKAAALLGEAVRQYEDAAEQASTLLTAYRNLEEARLLIRGYAPLLTNAPMIARGDTEAWTKVLKATRTLEELLNPGPKQEYPPDLRINPLGEDLRSRSVQLRELTNPLRRPFESASLKKLIRSSEQPDAGPANAQEIQRLLQMPLLPAEQREMLWKAGRRLALRLHHETLQLDQSDDALRQAPASLNSWNPEQQHQARRQEYQRAELRARVAIALSRLAGADADQLRRLDNDLNQAASEGTDSDSWSSLAHALYQLGLTIRKRTH